MIASSTPLNPAAAEPDIRAIKPLIYIPPPLLWLLLLAAALLATALAYLLWRRHRAKQAHRPPLAAPELSPYERARRKLDLALRLVERPREFAIVVADAIRVYLEERFRLHAPERTTEEFLDEIQTTAFLTFHQKGLLEQFLSQCDLVKFARNEPAAADLRALHAIAGQILDETRPPFHPAPLPAAAALAQTSAAP